MFWVLLKASYAFNTIQFFNFAFNTIQFGTFVFDTRACLGITGIFSVPLQDQESKLQPITIMPKYIKEASILGLVGGEGCNVGKRKYFL